MRILSDHSTFTSVTDLNESIRLHLRAHRYELNATAIKAFELVTRHAVKYPGAAWLKITTLAGLLGKSPATTRRALASLERAGMIERVSFMRRITGGNGGNIIRILPAKPTDDCPQMIARPIHAEPTAPSVAKAKPAAEALIFRQQTFKPSERTLQAPEPSTFYEHLQTLIKDRRDRREYMTAFKKQVATLLRFDVHKEHTDMLNAIAVRALYVALRRQQAGTVDNAVGYFYGVLKNQIDQALFDNVTDLYAADPEAILLADLPY